VRLLLACPERSRSLDALEAFLYEQRVDVVQVEQSSHADGLVCRRMELAVPRGLTVSALDLDLSWALAPHLDMTWQFSGAEAPKRCAILASKTEHCLIELLEHSRRGELAGDVVLVASNHPDLGDACESAGVPFHHIPVDRERRHVSEARLADLLAGSCDVVVLARYMQILSGWFLDAVRVPVINIHHSLLPAFVGAEPYERAQQRGVKFIGATAHYVTEELDKGPIIEQDVVRVTHRDDVKALKQLGAGVERTVLARAVKWHCEDRLLRHGNSVVVF
jgi:formyltetrahydrofolate deformylase